uniref:TIR domain-containing protein n=1 Tax=Gossypium raimondii TaxID=29730 RepID=A0A0D2RP58_GOSRA|nr:hypothetical protein B456_005G188500 [Gossypium raimondii]
MESAGVVSTTTPTSFRLRWDVFLSFRGEDTRHGITNALYCSLVGEGLRVFRDDDALRRGDEIAPNLVEAIEDSAAFVVILSENYATSRWCLEELARICELRSRSRSRRLVLPVFFGVDPYHVRKQRGPFKEAFFSHENRFGEKQANRWREAMAKVGSLAGLVKSDERELIRVLLREVLQQANNTPVEVATYAVGLDTRVTELTNLLDVKSNGIKVVGLHGIGGIGKTTLAKAVFNKILVHFDHRSFISNVRELSKQGDGLVSLQKKLIGDLFGSTGNFHLPADEFDANASRIRKIINENINEKRVLIVLDDVDQENQLNALGLGARVKWQNDGSIRIIITTRNKGVLNECYVNRTYEVRELHFDQALELFSYHALRREKPTKENVTEWEDALNKLRDVRPHELQDVLKISFDALDRENQRIFLDVGCCFLDLHTKREDVEKSLIKFTEGDALWMHDQLRDMGKEMEIAQNENDDPEMRSRLWDRNQIMTGTRSIEVHTKPFKSMVHLRLLQVNHVKQEGKFKFVPHELKWLQWQGCALKTLLSDFCPQKLAVLDLSESKIEKLWSSYSNNVAENLMVINLRGCPHLASLPDLSGHKNLQKIVLAYCVKLINIDKSVGTLISLHHLHMTGCFNLVEFPSDVSGMKNLQTLVLTDCSNLKELPEDIGSMRSLKELYVNRTGIEKLPESIYHLEKLEKLSLNRCIHIKQLPRCVGQLASLKKLHLDGSGLQELPDSVAYLENLEKLSLISCESLTAIPDTVGNLNLLKELFIKGKAITELPHSICSLSYLKCLNVRGIQMRKLPNSIRGLISSVELDIEGPSITCLPSQIGHLRLLEKLVILNCTSLESLPDSTGSLFALTFINICNASITELPESFGMLKNLITLRLDECRKLHKLPSSMGNLKSLHHFFGMLTCLMVLNMRKDPNKQEQPNSSFVALPASFTNLLSLQELDARTWRICGEIPDDFEKLAAIEILDLGSNDIYKLPSSLKGLSFLRDLKLPKCEKLQSLPPLPSSLEKLNLANCISLTTLSDLSNIKGLQELNLTNCEKLVDLPGLESLTSLRELYMSNCSTCASAAKKRLSKVYLKNLRNLSMPGSRIPDWFTQDMVTFSSHKTCDLTAMIIAVVVSINHYNPDELRYQLPAVSDIQAQIFNGVEAIMTTALNLIGVPRTNQDNWCDNNVHLCRYPAYRPLVSMLKDGFKIKVTRQNAPYVKGVELKKAGIFLVYEKDDDYGGDEDSLDENQQSVSEKLAKFFSSLEENDGIDHQSNCSHE